MQLHQDQTPRGYRFLIEPGNYIVEETNADFLPVVDVKNRLVGYIPRTRIYSMYRNMVADMSAE